MKLIGLHIPYENKGIYSILFYSILFYSILFYSILFYSILFYSILFYSIKLAIGSRSVRSSSFQTHISFPLDPKICGLGWILWNTKCYHFGNETSSNILTWMDARAVCRQGGGDLVSIHSQAEQDFVFNTLKVR